jgi:hypothetical protein
MITNQKIHLSYSITKIKEYGRKDDDSQIE